MKVGKYLIQTPCFKKKTATHGCLSAVVVGILLVILPLLFYIVVYSMPSSRTFWNSTPLLGYVCQGYYKDSTNGIRDCRCFSVALFFIQTVLLSLFAVTKTNYCFLESHRNSSCCLFSSCFLVGLCEEEIHYKLPCFKPIVLKSLVILITYFIE